MKPALQAIASSLPEIPVYIPSGNECLLFEHAWRRRLPVYMEKVFPRIGNMRAALRVSIGP